MSEQRTSGTATVMFTDVESSTDITTRLGDDAAASLLATHNTIVLDQVAAFGGHDVRSTGDGFLVVFDSARAAVSCALAIQRELTEREHPIRVRIGLNAGEVLHGGGDELFGAAINLAARVMDRADGGEILTTDTVRQLVGTMTEATFRDRGRVGAQGLRRAPAAVGGPPGRGPARGAAGARRAPRRSQPHADRRRRGRPPGGGGRRGGAPRRRLRVGQPGRRRAQLGRGHRSGQGSRRRDDPGGREPGTDLGGAGGVWVLNQNSATLSHIDVETRKLVDTRGIGGSANGGGVPGNVAASTQNVWLNAAGCNGAQTGAILHVVAGGEGGRNLGGGDDVPVAGAVPEHADARPPRAEAAASSRRGTRCGRRRTARTGWCGSTTTPWPGGRG